MMDLMAIYGSVWTFRITLKTEPAGFEINVNVRTVRFAPAGYRNIKKLM
jgi:hypothetical protein